MRGQPRYRQSPLASGVMRSRVTVQEETRTDDGQGNYTKVWGGSGHEWPIWAQKVYRTGGDTSEMQQDISRRRFEYTTRQRADVTFTSAMRILDGTMKLAIIAVANDDQDRSAQTLVAVELQD